MPGQFDTLSSASSCQSIADAITNSNLDLNVTEINDDSTLTRATSISKVCNANDMFLVYAYYDYLSSISGGVVLDKSLLSDSSMEHTLYLVKATTTNVTIAWSAINHAKFIQMK